MLWLLRVRDGPVTSNLRQGVAESHLWARWHPNWDCYPHSREISYAMSLLSYAVFIEAL